MTLFSSDMQKEKLAVIGLIVIIIVALSAFIAITYGQDILNNLFGGQGEVSAKDDSIICYENINNNISKILSNDQINLSSEYQIQLVSQPANGNINITNTSIRYTTNTNFLGADSFVYRLTQNDKSSQATVTISVEVAKIEIGDSTDLYYIGMFTNGTVFDTNIEDVAKANGIYNETNSYNVSRVFVDPSLELLPPEDFEENYTSDYIQGFLKGLIGMGECETKNVTIPPEDAYGILNESLAQ